MNGNLEIENAISNVKSAVEKLEQVQGVVEAAIAKTSEVLTIAESLGVRVVSLGKRHEKVNNGGWSFGAAGSIFTHPDDRVDGWPAAWRIAEQAGISTGAGNTGQHQIKHNSVIDGVYECRGGQWARIDD